MSTWPQVKDRLHALALTLPAFAAPVQVYNGQPVTQDAPLTFATFGYALDVDDVGGFEQTREGNGYFILETGSVVSEIVAWSGDPAEQGATATSAFALFDALQAAILADQTLGILAADATCTLSGAVRQLQTTAAAQTRLLVTASYSARL